MASHHPTIDPILPELRSALADLAPIDAEDPADQHGRTTPTARRRRSMPTTGWPICATRCGSARPWPRPARDHATFIEVSPHPLLTHAIGGTLESARPRGGIQVAANAEPRQPRNADLPHPAGHGSAAVGRDGAKTPAAQKRLVDIPPTPWLHSRYWAAPSSRPAGRRPALTRCWGCTSRCRPAAIMCGRQMSGPSSSPGWRITRCTASRSCPATGFAEMALAAGSEALGLPVHAVAVTASRSNRCFALDDRTQVTTQLIRGAEGPSTRFASRSIRARPTATGVGMRSPESRWRSPRCRLQRPSSPRGDRHRRVARGLLRRVAPHRFASRAGVRRVDPDRPQARRFFGDRDRPARRGDSRTGVTGFIR